MKLITKLFIFIDILAAICFFLVYGPYDYLRTFWITTAMETGNHKFLAHIFYSDKTISEVLTNNFYVEITSESDPKNVTINSNEQVTNYVSKYEEQILSRNPDDLYKLIEFKYGEFDCYLVAIYDPTRIHAVAANNLYRGEILTNIAKRNEAIVAINGGGYSWANSLPSGVIVSDGNLIYSDGQTLPTAAFNDQGIMIAGSFSKYNVAERNIKQALSFNPILISDGVPVTIRGTGGSGMNPRTVIAQRKDGIVLFLVVNGYGQKLSWKGRGGVYLNDLLVILQRYGAYNAVNMDGGSSTTMVINNQLINSPCEPVQEGQDFIRSAWILK